MINVEDSLIVPLREVAGLDSNSEFRELFAKSSNLKPTNIEPIRIFIAVRISYSNHVVIMVEDNLLKPRSPVQRPRSAGSWHG